MLNKVEHRRVMGQILRDIYSDVSIASLLGLKGGTCAYFFYGLPRFSIDLDFDFLSTDKEKLLIVFEKIKKILGQYGKIKDAQQKRYTLFFLLSYGVRDHNVKIEINIRELLPQIKNYYELRSYSGVSMLVAKKDYLFAGKLNALGGRLRFAMRDVYDTYYFLKNNWDINEEILHSLTGREIKEHLKKCILDIEKVPESSTLAGLGELLDEKEKNWVKRNLKKEVIFLLKNYLAALG